VNLSKAKDCQKEEYIKFLIENQFRDPVDNSQRNHFGKVWLWVYIYQMAQTEIEVIFE